MTHTTRHTSTRRKHGRKKGSIVKSTQKHKIHSQCTNRRKSMFNMRTGQAQIRIKSKRVQERGYRKRYCENDDGLECFTEYCGMANSHGDKYDNDDGDVDNDTDTIGDDNEADEDDEDDDHAWKYTDAAHDREWKPKSHEKSETANNNHDSVISGKHTQGSHHHYDDEEDDNDKDDSDHDNGVPSMRSHDGDHIFNAIFDNCYHHNANDDDDDDAPHSHGNHDSADHIDEDDLPTDHVGYVRRKRRSVNTLLKHCDKRRLPRDASKCPTSLSHLVKLISLWSNEHVFPSWKSKKPRAVCKKQDTAGEGFAYATAELENGTCNVQVHNRLNTTVQQKPQQTDCDNVCIFPAWQRKRPHISAMSQQGDALLPSSSNSPAVSLSTVLEELPKESAEPELLSSFHGDDRNSNNQPSNTTGAKRSLSRRTQEEAVDDTEKEKSQAPIGKPKRKKHRPKVQRDISQKAKRAPKNIKRKVPAQEGDGPQSEKPKRVRKKQQPKKRQDAGDSFMESSTMPKEQCCHKQGKASPMKASDTLKDNMRTECLFTFNGESSIIPFRSTLLQSTHNHESQNGNLLNLTVTEVACMHDLLASKGELSTCMHMAEGHISVVPELINCMQGNKLPFYCQFLGHIPHVVYESRLAPLWNSPEESNVGSYQLALVDSKPDSCTQLLLAQEPHNQLEMVVYDQRREVVVSKSAKSRVKIRAKVQLDAENERMWPLLILGGIPTEFEDVLYWERERSIMEKHVSLFIHNMQAVQGHRHFSPWKGSILDSVVGAFLTQNVSDHLSSSAFMSVAARYPAKQRNNTSLSDETPNEENQSALEMSKISYEIQSATQDMYKTSSGSVDEEASKQQEIKNVSNLDDSRRTSSCETNECSEQTNPCSSLRGVKSILRNIGASQPTEIRDIKSKSDSLASIGASITAYRNSPHLLEFIESSDDIANATDNNNITVDSTRQSGLVCASFHLPMEDNDTTKASISSHNGIATDYTPQGGMQNLEKASSRLGTSTDLCSNNILGLDLPNGPSANHTWRSVMQHEDNHSQGSIKENIANEPRAISTFNLSPQNYNGQDGLQHLDRAFPCSMEEDISMNQNDLHGKSIIVKHDLCNSDDSCIECLDREKNFTLGTGVICDHDLMSSASKFSGLVDSSNTNSSLQEVKHSLAESLVFEQYTTDRSWPNPDPRTEVYSKSTISRNLFKNNVPVQIHSNTDTLLSTNNDVQAPINFNVTHTQNHLAVIQESKQMVCGSDIFHGMTASSPVSTILGDKRRHALGGIERAHLEENQHGRKKNLSRDWESMRRQTLESCSSNESMCKENIRKDAYQDSVDWDAVRRAGVEELAETIKERGMHHVLSGRIKAFLKTLHEEQGNLDLEWIRKVSPENAKAYLENIRGLGVKSVECIRLLTLHHVAFPVDVNVGRICVRLGWVPIEPLPEELQLHLLELYPVQETIQKFLWPRLCMLDQKTLYELHYQLITFGKVFCTKSKPNCNACPMRTNCKHFASAYASAKLLLTGPNNEPSKRLCLGTPIPALMNSSMDTEGALVENVECKFAHKNLERDYNTNSSLSICQQYIVEEPASPEKTPEPDIEQEIADIEDFPCIYGSFNDFTEDLLKVSELPYESLNGDSNDTHKEINKKWEEDAESEDVQVKTLCMTPTSSCCNTSRGSCSNTTEEQFSSNSMLSTTRPTLISCSSCESNLPPHEKFLSCGSVEEEASDVSEGVTTALVSLPEGAYIPAPKLKNIDRLRTVHYVYELPDDHPLLEHADIREKDDPSFYLLAIWSPGEAPESLNGIDEDRQEELCRFSSGNADETIPGTLLIPCRTAMRGSFPLNGTYFQVNEVFADHDSSLRPFQVPRSHIWRLQRRFVYFGTSVSNIFRGLTLDEIKTCFLRGYVCVRGFDRKDKTPRPLVCRLHFPISKQIHRHKKDETQTSNKNCNI